MLSGIPLGLPCLPWQSGSYIHVAVPDTAAQPHGTICCAWINTEGAAAVTDPHGPLVLMIGSNPCGWTSTN